MKRTPKKKKQASIRRREILQFSAATVGAGALVGVGTAEAAVSQVGEAVPEAAPGKPTLFGGTYTGAQLSRVAFPMGGMGAGMICLEGSGALSHFSLRNHPDVFNEPCVFAAISVKGKHKVARVLEGPVPSWKLFGAPGSANGASGASYGLPRFRQAAFTSRFPFGSIKLIDDQVPLDVEMMGWSPFTPNDADNSSLPVAALEYLFTNRSDAPIEAVFSFNARNFMAIDHRSQSVKAVPGGFVLQCEGDKERAWDKGAFLATVDDPGVKVNAAWFRGGFFDALTMAWKDIADGACFDRPAIAEGDPSPGATLFVPFTLAPGASKKIALRLAWYVGYTNIRQGENPKGKSAWGFLGRPTYRPWYARRFANITEVADYWRKNYDLLQQNTRRFTHCFYDSTLPPEVIEAVAVNLSILKSPTVLRQADGRLWAYEGCCDSFGCCHGSCTHVWNYAQAIPHLFPELERTLRETEFGPSQDERGHQTFRASLPIRPVTHTFHAAADGQLGGIMKVYREWRISADLSWLRRLWPKVKASLDYCIKTWDPDGKGLIEEPHHNTYDIEFWGPDGMCTSFYLGALQAAVFMGQALGEEDSKYASLLKKGVRAAEKQLFNGEYFIQKIEWKKLHAKSPLEVKHSSGTYPPEGRALLEKEGPKYQYGNGCLSDGVLGAWIAMVCGVGQVLDRTKIVGHLKAVHRYNLKQDLSDFANPQRPSYACGAEGGLLLCTWPKGGELSLPFVYSNEVWTGIEYQVASHLMMMGLVDEGLEIVRTCRKRYDGRVRNPFNEYECGHWYARAMSSYGLLQGLTGARYDAVEKTLYLQPSLPGDFRSFLSTATGYGTVGVKDGKPFLEVKEGNIEVRRIKMTPVKRPV